MVHLFIFLIGVGNLSQTVPCSLLNGLQFECYIGVLFDCAGQLGCHYCVCGCVSEWCGWAEESDQQVDHLSQSQTCVFHPRTGRRGHTLWWAPWVILALWRESWLWNFRMNQICLSPWQPISRWVFSLLFPLQRTFFCSLPETTKTLSSTQSSPPPGLFSVHPALVEPICKRTDTGFLPRFQLHLPWFGGVRVQYGRHQGCFQRTICSQGGTRPSMGRIWREDTISSSRNGWFCHLKIKIHRWEMKLKSWAPS